MAMGYSSDSATQTGTATMLPLIRRTIERKRYLLIKQATDARQRGHLGDKADAEMRLRFLSSIQERLHAESALADRPKLFISFSTQHGQRYYEKVAAKATSHGFDVHDGFKRPREANVLRAVHKAIA